MLYDSESYVLRNSISDIIKNIIICEIGQSDKAEEVEVENDIVI